MKNSARSGTKRSAQHTTPHAKTARSNRSPAPDPSPTGRAKNRPIPKKKRLELQRWAARVFASASAEDREKLRREVEAIAIGVGCRIDERLRVGFSGKHGAQIGTFRDELGRHSLHKLGNRLMLITVKLPEGAGRVKIQRVRISINEALWLLTEKIVWPAICRVSQLIPSCFASAIHISVNRKVVLGNEPMGVKYRVATPSGKLPWFTLPEKAHSVGMPADPAVRAKG